MEDRRALELSCHSWITVAKDFVLAAVAPCPLPLGRT